MRTLASGLSLALLLCLPGLPLADTPGRTDGPEMGEYGKGGYPFGGRTSRLYVTPSFGTGFYQTSGGHSQTGLLYGMEVGVEAEGWVGLHGSYAYITDRRMSIAGVGARFTWRSQPFAFHASVQPGIYAPRVGSSAFGLATGGGISVLPHERIEVGLQYTHDMIFSDRRGRVDRVFATVGIFF